ELPLDNSKLSRPNLTVLPGSGRLKFPEMDFFRSCCRNAEGRQVFFELSPEVNLSEYYDSFGRYVKFAGDISSKTSEQTSRKDRAPGSTHIHLPAISCSQDLLARPLNEGPTFGIHGSQAVNIAGPNDPMGDVT